MHATDQPTAAPTFVPEAPWHQPYWLTFDGRAPACMEALTEAGARADAEALTGCKVLTAERTPYPVGERLRPFRHPVHGADPIFCIRGPGQCKGERCPLALSCDH